MLRICFAFVLSALAPAPLVAEAPVEGRVAVIDADTWDVGGVRIRLHGIDAPELDQTCEDADGVAWACGRWATAQVAARYDGRRANCAVLDTDRHGRVVARCHIGGRDAARQMVSDGWAFAFRRYSLDYDLEEKSAAVALRGLHGSRVQSPAEFRRNGPSASQEGCAIKGNVAASGERIYHVPGQQHYGRTRISPGKGERWFCSEAEARAAGWRPARR